MPRFITLIVLSVLSSPAMAQYDPGSNTITVTVGPVPLPRAAAICDNPRYFSDTITCTQPLIDANLCNTLGENVSYPTVTCNQAAVDAGVCSTSQVGQDAATPRGCAAWLRNLVIDLLRARRNEAIERREFTAIQDAIRSRLDEPLESQ